MVQIGMWSSSDRRTSKAKTWPRPRGPTTCRASRETTPTNFAVAGLPTRPRHPARRNGRMPRSAVVGVDSRGRGSLEPQEATTLGRPHRSDPASRKGPNRGIPQGSTARWLPHGARGRTPRSGSVPGRRPCDASPSWANCAWGQRFVGGSGAPMTLQGSRPCHVISLLRPPSRLDPSARHAAQDRPARPG